MSRSEEPPASGVLEVQPTQLPSAPELPGTEVLYSGILSPAGRAQGGRERSYLALAKCKSQEEMIKEPGEEAEKAGG